LGNTAEERGASISSYFTNDGVNPLPDFAEAVSSLESLIDRFGRVIVQCRAGRSRSIAVVTAYITRVQGVSTHKALELVRGKRESAAASALIRLVEKTADA
jgi:protein-tyrosine phosphatase